MHIWQRHRRSFFWVLGFVVVVWAALTVTAPPPASTGKAVTVHCPPSAPNAAAGCVTLR
jgi:hypothetical protein